MGKTPGRTPAARKTQGEILAKKAVEIADEATAESLNLAKLRVSTRLAAAAMAERAELRAAANAERAAAAEAASGAKPKVIFVAIRDFVPVRLEDGRVITREYLADGSFIDHE